MNFLHATAPAGVAVTVSARLHLGFLDLNGEFGRQFGSLGLSISETARTPHIASRQRGSGPLAGLGVRVSRCNAKRRREPEATPPQSRRYRGFDGRDPLRAATARPRFAELLGRRLAVSAEQ
jgi:hypothetical protein